MSPRESIRQRFKKVSGGKVAFFALALLMLGITIEFLSETEAQYKRTAGGMELGCETRVEGQTVRLAIGGSITNRGRNVTCRNYDGHPVLIYTTLDN